MRINIEFLKKIIKDIDFSDCGGVKEWEYVSYGGNVLKATKVEFEYIKGYPATMVYIDFELNLGD